MAAETGAGARPVRRPPWVAALAAGVVAAGLSWGAGEVANGLFAPQLLVDPMKGPTAGAASNEDIRRGRVLDATLTYGVQGAVLGLLLGLAGASVGGTGRSGAIGGAAGLAAGGLLGAGGASILFSIYLENVDPNANDLLFPLAIHAGVWSLVGLAGGLALGLGAGGGRSRIARVAVGGLVGGAIGAAVYEVGGAILFPIAKTSQPIAEEAMARLLAHSVTSVLAALVAAMSLAEPKPRRGASG
ncbi:hypothetical protein [Tautonia sociabilis]|uniref:Uncharacterized protein n=1 Tax=Tautonia sociabilis TaxID=2080755 RepID=A0A432MNX2_9BACT|nr:hypothetical protein [Tautonia sociabilis]RUL89134.1 hypothetical protein TsocGM_03175 [Tautonia sociabilis]